MTELHFKALEILIRKSIQSEVENWKLIQDEVEEKSLYWKHVSKLVSTQIQKGKRVKKVFLRCSGAGKKSCKILYLKEEQEKDFVLLFKNPTEQILIA